jgi:hypothetical protein
LLYATRKERNAYNARPSAEKREVELKVFTAFAQSAQFCIDPGTVRNEEPPLPDIFCEVDSKPYYFESGEITDEDLAAAQKRISTPGDALKDEEPFLRMFRKKAKCSYKTGGAPVDLILYFDKQYPIVEGVSEHLTNHAREIRHLTVSGPFARVWIYSTWDGVVLWKSSP